MNNPIKPEFVEKVTIYDKKYQLYIEVKLLNGTIGGLGTGISMWTDGEITDDQYNTLKEYCKQLLRVHKKKLNKPYKSKKHNERSYKNEY